MKGIIYKWTCNKSGKSYVGQTINETRREKEFLSENEVYTKENSKIDRARKKYGLKNGIWSKEVLKRLWCKDGKENELLDRLNYWEKYYIEKYNTFNDGYNSTDGGSNGFLISDETRSKLKEISLSWWNNLSDEKKEELRKISRKKQKEWWNNLSDIEKENLRKESIKRNKEWWNNLSNSQRKKFCEKSAITGKEWWNGLSDEERENFYKKSIKRNKEWWDSLSDEEKNKHKEKSKVWLGKNRDSKTCEALRKKQTGKLKSSKIKDKIRNSVLSSNGLINQCKPIKQFDLNGNLIKEYSSISEVVKLNGFKYDGIVRCARGLQKKSKGYIWRFSNKEDEKINRHENKGYYFHKRLGKYRARIRINGKEYNLGFYRNEKAASAVYKLALENKDNINKWFKNIENIKRSIIKKYD